MGRLKKIKRMVKDFVYGMTVADMVWEAKKEKSKRNAAMMIVAIGDLIGLPTLSPIYKINLLMYWLPEIEVWKRYVLREKDFLE